DGQIENTHEDGFTYADPQFLRMMNTPFIYGSADHALTEANTIVLTKSKADKYVPGEEPVGKIMIVNNDESKPYKVDGVIADIPDASHFHYDFFITLSGREFFKGEQTNWLTSNYPTYILVQPGTKPSEREKKLDLIGSKYYLPRLLDAGYPNAKEQ